MAATATIQGVVKSYGTHTGWGFIKTEKGDVFFHLRARRAMNKQGFTDTQLCGRTPKPGDHVVLERGTPLPGKTLPPAQAWDFCLPQPAKIRYRIIKGKLEIWQGTDLAKLEVKCDEHDNRSLSFERKEDGRWVRCPDPRAQGLAITA